MVVPAAAVIVFLLAVIVLSLVYFWRLNRQFRALARVHAGLLDSIAGQADDGDDGDFAPVTPADRTARMMAELRDAIAPIAEAALGERLAREAEDWSFATAEQMAMMVYATGMSRFGGIRVRVQGDDDA